MLEYSSSTKFLETESHQVSQCFGVSTGIHGAICKCHLQHLLHPCMPTSHSHLRASSLAFTSGQVHAKHAGPHLSQTHFHLTKECAPNIHQVSSGQLHQCCAEDTARFFFSWTPSLEVDYVMQCPLHCLSCHRNYGVHR